MLIVILLEVFLSKLLKKNEEIVESLGERILGRVSLHDVLPPSYNEIIVNSGEEISEEIVEK